MIVRLWTREISCKHDWYALSFLLLLLLVAAASTSSSTAARTGLLLQLLPPGSADGFEIVVGHVCVMYVQTDGEVQWQSRARVVELLRLPPSRS